MHSATPLPQQPHATGRPLIARLVRENPIARTLDRSRFREVRFRTYVFPIIASIIERKGSCTILDMGGDPESWRHSSLQQAVKILILNIERKEKPADPRIEVMEGDARDVPSLGDGSFDFVYSNSLIEHVGRWSDMKRVAAEIRRLAPAYYVQTPNFWFPIDPHSNMPFIHWLPQSVQRRVFSSKARGFYKKPGNFDEAMGIIDGTSMLDRQQMAALFPGADILAEPFLFLSKSFVAIKRS